MSRQEGDGVSAKDETREWGSNESASFQACGQNLKAMFLIDVKSACDSCGNHKDVQISIFTPYFSKVGKTSIRDR